MWNIRAVSGGAVLGPKKSTQSKTGSDEDDIDILKKYGRSFSEKIKTIEEEVKELTKDVNKLCGIKGNETGLL